MLERILLREFGEEADSIMSVCMLTGRPAEEMPGSAGDLLSELSQLHKQVRQVMQGVAIRLLARGRCTAYGEDQESTAALPIMEDIGQPTGCQRNLGHVKTRYTKADPNHMSEVRLVGPDGKEIPVSLVYGQVQLAAKYSPQDCKLDRLLDGIEEEFSQSA